MFTERFDERSEFLKIISGLALSLMLCGIANAQTQTFQVRLDNLTSSAPNSGQPFSRPIFATHNNNVTFWTPNEAASNGVRQIAEEGDNAPFLLDLALAGSDVSSQFVGGAPVLPGGSLTFMVTTDAAHPFLSSIWMLGRTNDGFSGNVGFDLFSLAPGGSAVLNLIGLDAGTEVNNEKAAFLPALGGNGLNEPEFSVIGPHSGIRGDADAPASWNWTGPTSRITITAAAAPEPGTLALLPLALLALPLLRRTSKQGI
jgi:hypothetical protein